MEPNRAEKIDMSKQELTSKAAGLWTGLPGIEALLNTKTCTSKGASVALHCTVAKCCMKQHGRRCPRTAVSSWRPLGLEKPSQSQPVMTVAQHCHTVPKLLWAVASIAQRPRRLCGRMSGQMQLPRAALYSAAWRQCSGTGTAAHEGTGKGFSQSPGSSPQSGVWRDPTIKDKKLALIDWLQ